MSLRSFRLTLVAALVALVALGAIGGAGQEAAPAKMRFHRKIRIVQGQAEAAGRWARQITDYAQAKMPDHPIAVYLETTPGGNGTIHWFVDTDDPEAFQQVMASLATDQAYNDLLSKPSGLVADGGPVDAVLTAIP